MNPPGKNTPLSSDLLLGALRRALCYGYNTYNVPYEVLVLNSSAWGHASFLRHVLHVCGLTVDLRGPRDIEMMLRQRYGSYGFDDTSAYILPAPAFGQDGIVELDFGYEVTEAVEAVLRSGAVTVFPREVGSSGYQEVRVCEREVSEELNRIIAPNDYHASWQLRENIRIRISDGEVFIAKADTVDSTPANDVATELHRRYGVTVSVAQLREKFLSRKRQLETLADRIAFFETLNNQSGPSGTNHQL